MADVPVAALPVPFLGTHTPKLDDKGRLILPAKFREPLAAGLVMAKGQERCIVVYPMADRQGRITIPPMLREYAALDRDLAVIGNISRVEIWQLDAWNTYLAEKEPGFAAQSEEVMPGRF